MSGGFKASIIPNNVKKTIQNIKEITGNHSDEDIYSMLKECAMDPNETAQKLLLQDTFHEVKRRRDRKKENQTSRDTADLRWRSGGPGRGGRGSRGSYASRYAAKDAGGGINIPAKENGISQASNKIASASASTVQESKKKVDGSSVTEMLNGPVDGALGGRGTNTDEIFSGRVAKELLPQSLSGERKRSDTMSGGNMESIKRHVRSHRSFAEPSSNISLDKKSNAVEVGSKSQGVGKNQSPELQFLSLSHGSSSSNRPSSNYGSRSQQALGSQKVGPNKEWKPKATNAVTVQGGKTPGASEGSTSGHPQSVDSISNSEGATTKCQKELERLHVRDAQHVIIPNHIHVPDVVRTGLSFGSFDAPYVVTSNKPSKSEMENSNSLSQRDLEIEETVEEATSQREEVEYNDDSQSPKQVVNLSVGDVSVTASSVSDFSDSKGADNAPQVSSVQTSAGYNFGLLPPMLGNPLESLEASETQSRDAPIVSSFLVQPSVDPSSFYAQFYRSGSDRDGRVSPFPEHAVASKYSGNGAVLSAQTPQSTTEGGNPLAFSTAPQTSLATPTAGMMPNSRAVPQQPMPLFRQPAVHIPHYPPNYVPYGHYFPPFYVPPPAMHQFLGNNTFPPQAQAGSVYPVQPAPVVAPTQVKFPMSQYKPGSNAGNSMHMGMGGGYGPYGPISATSAGNSTAIEDFAASQFKENTLYITGQKSEGSAVWIPAPGRDITNLPANSFYNIAPQGQHLTFTPSQAGLGTFAGIYHPHPAQAVTGAAVHPLLQQSQPMPMPGAVDMVGPTPNVFQQSQHTQINWPNNY